MAKVILTALKQHLLPNDNVLYVKAAPGDNVYVIGGVTLDISGNKILDPNEIGVVGPSQQPILTPGIWNESLDGYYAEVIPSTTGLGGYKLRYWLTEGTELSAGAYPAAITAGQLILAIAFEQ